LENHELIGDGEGIHWQDLDEDMSVEGILAGRRSGECQSSLEKWLKKKNGSGSPRCFKYAFMQFFCIRSSTTIFAIIAVL
jgi:uncharacterized protein DUF2442